MLLLRRIATGVVVAAALAVLVLSVYLLWNARQWDYLPLQSPYTSDLDARAQLFQDKLEIYSRRVNDMESLVIILLGITGLYTIIFILTADFNSRSINRQVNRALESVDQKISASLGDLRQFRDEAREALHKEVNAMADRVAAVQEQGRQIIEELRAELQASPAAGEIARVLERIDRRVSEMSNSAPQVSGADESRHEVMHYEGALPALELFHARQFAPQLASIYRGLARYYVASDRSRAKFYLGRAAALAPDDFKTANELGALALNGTAPGANTGAASAPDYGQAKHHFEASLAARPEQQRAAYGLAMVAKAQGNLESAQNLLEGALRANDWETAPDANAAAEIHYALACVLTRRAQTLAPGPRAQYLVRATEELRAALAQPSQRIEEMLSRDTEEGGDLFLLANTMPYQRTIDELLLNVQVGAA